MIPCCELEENKKKFQAIFDEDSSIYTFANAKQIKLVNEYGMITGELSKAIELTNLHIKIQANSARCGVYIEDDAIIDFIRSIYTL